MRIYGEPLQQAPYKLDICGAVMTLTNTALNEVAFEPVCDVLDLKRAIMHPERSRIIVGDLYKYKLNDVLERLKKAPEGSFTAIPNLLSFFYEGDNLIVRISERITSETATSVQLDFSFTPWDVTRILSGIEFSGILSGALTLEDLCQE